MIISGVSRLNMAKLANQEAGYVNQPGYSFVYDVESIKLLPERMCVGVPNRL